MLGFSVRNISQNKNYVSWSPLWVQCFGLRCPRIAGLWMPHPSIIYLSSFTSALGERLSRIYLHRTVVHGFDNQSHTAFPDSKFVYCNTDYKQLACFGFCWKLLYPVQKLVDSWGNMSWEYQWQGVSLLSKGNRVIWVIQSQALCEK